TAALPAQQQSPVVVSESSPANSPNVVAIAPRSSPTAAQSAEPPAPAEGPPVPAAQVDAAGAQAGPRSSANIESQPANEQAKKTEKTGSNFAASKAGAKSNDSTS